MARQKTNTNHGDNTFRSPARRSRRWGALLTTVAVAASVSACGGNDTTDDATDDAEGAIEDATDEVVDAVEDVSGAVADAIDEFGEDAVEVVARNLASTNAAQEFRDAGHPIEGELRCTADATEDLTAVELDCSGATEDGGVASMTGSTTELPGASVTELEGDFVGFVDNVEVFATDALG